MNIFVTVPVIGSTCLLCVIYIFVTGVMNIFLRMNIFVMVDVIIK